MYYSLPFEKRLLSSQDAWQLDDPCMIWRVESGQVDVFVVPLSAGRVSGNRTHLIRVEAGGVMVGMRTLDELGLLAVPVMQAEVTRLERTNTPSTSDLTPLILAWANALAQAAGQDNPSDTLADWDALDAFHAGILVALRELRAAEFVRESKQLADRGEWMDEMFAASLASADALLDEHAQWVKDFQTGGNVLLAACNVIGRHAGITFKAPPAYETNDDPDPVRTIAQASDVRVRRVALNGRWHTSEQGPLLAFIGDTQHPVALIPGKPGVYNMVDPVTRKFSRLDAATAATINVTAYMFYRPLPSKPVNGRDLIRYVMKGASRDIWAIVLMGILGGLLSLLLPWLTGIIYSNIIPGGEVDQLAQIAAALAVAALASTIFTLTRSFAMLRIEGRGDNALQAAIWDRVLAMPARFFREFTAGDLSTRIMTVNGIRQILSGTIVSSILSGVFSIFNLLLIFYYSWKMAILAVVLVAISMIFTFFVAIAQLKYQRRALTIKGEISGMLFQFLSAIAKLRDTASEVRAFSRWSECYTAAQSTSMRSRYYGIASSVFSSSYMLFCTLCVYAVFFFFLSGTMTNAHFLAFSSAFGQFMAALLAMSSGIVSLYSIRPMYERARPILEAVPEVDPTRLEPGRIKGRIEVRHVYFRYKPDMPYVLENFSLTINPGEYLAIVGPSGAGKSTIFRLLLGFDDPEAGDIFYDGKSLKKIKLPSLRRQINVVLQNGQLFGGPIFDNIVGSSALTQEDAWRAARMAGLEEDIKAMPMGMHTMVPPSGGTLSGGQRQRLLIARSFVKQAPILLFDEATSALDNQTQAVVMNTLDNLKATRVVIAQRLSTIVNAHRICVLSGGKFVQEGTYKDLSEQEGPFKDLCRRQFL